jgi:hypothetical protein
MTNCLFSLCGSHFQAAYSGRTGSRSTDLRFPGRGTKLTVSYFSHGDYFQGARKPSHLQQDHEGTGVLNYLIKVVALLGEFFSSLCASSS